MFGWLKKKSVNREIAINVENLETRVAVIENGRVEEFQVEHPSRERLVGCIYKGRIQNLEHDLQAAFVDIGMSKNAFLHYWDMQPDDDMRLEKEEGGNSRGKRGGRKNSGRRKRYTNEQIAKQFPPGSEIVVQVTKGPIGTKGPRVTASLSIPGRYLVMMPGSKLKGVSRKIGDSEERLRLKKVLDRLPSPRDIGLIVRTAAMGARKSSFARDLRGLISIWEDLQRGICEDKAPCCVYQEPDLIERVVRDWLTEDVDRIVVDSQEGFERIREVASRISRRARALVTHYDGSLPIFDHLGVSRQLAEAFRRKVMLSGGGCLVFDETEAMIAVDVNTGRHKGKGSQEDAILEVNIEAVQEVARQLRLRNVGGLVVIDLIDMKARKNQNMVYREMRAELKRDKARTNVLPISELGLMEMTRQRVEESIHSQMFMDCPYCNGHGSVKSPLALSVDLQRQISAVMRRMQQRSDEPHLQIVVHPTVLDRLRKEDEKFLMELQEEFHGSMSFKSDASRHVESFSIVDSDNGKVLYSVNDENGV